MTKVREGNFLRKLKWNKNKNWKDITTKALSYLLVVVVTVAVVIAVMDSQVVRLGRIEAATKRLDAANTEAKDLLEQVSKIRDNTKTMLDEVAQREEEVSKKIEELENAYEDTLDQENLRWVLPLRYHNVSSPYGNRTHPVSGEYSFHTGIDLAAPEGTPVVASRSGTVVKAEYQNEAGNFVIIDHYDGYDSSYLHMKKYIVEVGQVVIAGQVIGYCGETGTATGPHLHFEVYKDGRRVNPSKLLDLY